MIIFCTLFNYIHIFNNEIMPQRLLIAGGTGIATGGIGAAAGAASGAVAGASI